MPIKTSISYYVREERDIEGLARLRDYPIHLSLKHGYQSLLHDIGKAVVDEGLQISSIHAPKFQPEKGTEQFRTLATLLGAKTFTIHSDKRTVAAAEGAWLPVLETLAKDGIYVAFENTRKTGDWLSNPYDIPRHPLFNVTLDFNHIPKEHPDELQVLADLADKVKVVHVVDRHDTAPYSRWAELLPLAVKKLPHAEFVFEYGRNNMEFMLADYKAIAVEQKRVEQEQYAAASRLLNAVLPDEADPKA